MSSQPSQGRLLKDKIMIPEELEVILIDFMGRNTLTDSDVHIFRLAQDELIWTEEWEAWGRQQRVAEFVKTLGD